MNWQFWRKQEVQPQQGREFVIPPEKMKRIASLRDAYYACPEDQSSLARYEFWSAIAEVVPEVSRGAWAFDATSPLRYVVREQL